jgi:hypothetical protein
MSQIDSNEFSGKLPLHKPCEKCNNVMVLAVIQPEGERIDRRVFECIGCGHSESVVPF